MPARQNILILDDDKFFSSLARRLAASSGSILEECNDPNEINPLKLCNYDLILLDIMMPGINGVQIINSIRQYAPATGVVLVTSVERALIDSISDLAGELGVRIHGVLQKPYKAKELLALIESNGKLPKDHSTKPVAAADASRGNQALLLLQPQVSLSSGKWLGCEAVVGQNSTQNSQVGKSKPPGRAIGSGNPIHTDIEFVLKTLTHAVQLMKELEFKAGRPLSLSFSIPAQAMLHNDFARILVARLRQKNFPGSLLVLNITDSDHVKDSEQLHANIALLRQENVRFSLRYFSSDTTTVRNTAGYDEIRIDRSYIVNLRNSKSDKDFLKLLLDRSAKMCVPTVAEGIADLETFQWLSAHGCDIGQGPYVCGLEDVGGLVQWHQSWATGSRNRHHAPARDGSSIPDRDFQKV